MFTEFTHRKNYFSNQKSPDKKGGERVREAYLDTSCCPPRLRDSGVHLPSVPTESPSHYGGIRPQQPITIPDTTQYKPIKVQEHTVEQCNPIWPLAARPPPAQSLPVSQGDLAAYLYSTVASPPSPYMSYLLAL